MIDAENVTFDYPSGRALHGVGFVVRTGAVLALVGPDGAGKSTLMRCIAALDAPGEGRIHVAGLDTQADPRGVHAALGYLPEVFGLYDTLSVRRALAYAARTRGVAVAQTQAAVALAAQRVGLADRLDRLAGELSRGLRQRLAIGQAIVHSPRVLLLDEPAAGLDTGARHALCALIRELAETGMTVVVSSPLLSDLEDCCSEMLMLDEGRIGGGGVVRVPPRMPEPAAAETPAEPARVRVDLAVDVPDLGETLTALGCEVESVEAASAVLQIAPGAEAERDVLARLVGAGLPVRGFTPIRATLEDAYMAAEVDAGAAP